MNSRNRREDAFSVGERAAVSVTGVKLSSVWWVEWRAWRRMSHPILGIAIAVRQHLHRPCCWCSQLPEPAGTSIASGRLDDRFEPGDCRHLALTIPQRVRFTSKKKKRKKENKRTCDDGTSRATNADWRSFKVLYQIAAKYWSRKWQWTTLCTPSLHIFR